MTFANMIIKLPTVLQNVGSDAQQQQQQQHSNDGAAGVQVQQTAPGPNLNILQICCLEQSAPRAVLAGRGIQQ